MATIVTRSAGDWNDVNTWLGGVIPTAADDASIYDAVTFSTSITARNIYIYPGGSLSVDEGAATIPSPGTASFEEMILYRTLDDARRVNLDGIILDPDRVLPCLSCTKIPSSADTFPVTPPVVESNNIIIDDPGFISSSAILRDIKPEGCSPAYAEKVSNAVRYLTVTIHIKSEDINYGLTSLYRMARGPFQVLLVTHSCVIKGYVESVVPDPASVGKEYVAVKVTVTEGPGA